MVHQEFHAVLSGCLFKSALDDSPSISHSSRVKYSSTTDNPAHQVTPPATAAPPRLRHFSRRGDLPETAHKSTFYVRPARVCVSVLQLLQSKLVISGEARSPASLPVTFVPVIVGSCQREIREYEPHSRGSPNITGQRESSRVDRESVQRAADDDVVKRKADDTPLVNDGGCTEEKMITHCRGRAARVTGICCQKPCCLTLMPRVTYTAATFSKC
ncbi:hypothetical protein JOB18_040427 [Solea senegalensis]|uniref:Uncharacterized protein n=1 Tax=Solea senegalensis TaxID=28829 RepID=A0AAV6RN66_SOLSE|nr:hypothetical protein JOB18_040427 [Solea senegalensis]